MRGRCLRDASLTAGSLAVLLLAAAPSARAMPAPDAPSRPPSAAPSTAAPATTILLAGAPIDFVLDEAIDSRNTAPGTIVAVHLAKDLNVGGVTIAPAGSPASLKVISTQRAAAPNVDGSIRIYFDRLPIPGRADLPIRPTHELLTIELTAGQQSTAGISDAAKDIFIPGHFLYRAILRKGHDLVLPANSILRARTAATIDATNPKTIVITTPPPFVINMDPVHSDFTPIPLHTVAPPAPKNTPTPRRTITPAP